MPIEASPLPTTTPARDPFIHNTALFVLIAWTLGTVKWIAEVARRKGRSALRWCIGYFFATLLGVVVGAAIPIFIAAIQKKAQNDDAIDIAMVVGAIVVGVLFGKYLDRRPSLIAEPVKPQWLSAASPRYFLFQNEAQSGPFSTADLRQMTAAGQISPDAFYCFEGSDTWQPIAKLDRMLRTHP